MQIFRNEELYWDQILTQIAQDIPAVPTGDQTSLPRLQMDKHSPKPGWMQSGCDLVWCQKEFPDPRNTELVQSSPFQVLCTKLVQSSPLQAPATLLSPSVTLEDLQGQGSPRAPQSGRGCNS